MAEFESTYGIYMGRVLVAEGTKKDGNKFRNWKLSFKPTENSEKLFSLSYFQNMVNDAWDVLPVMDEGKWYTMAYVVRPYTNQYGDQKSKNVYKIVEGKHDIIKPKISQQKEQNVQPDAVPEVKFDAQKWVDFKQEYDLLMKDSPQKSAMHMLGVYLVNCHADKFSKEIEMVKHHFTKK